jgi:hypothetical protein
MFLGDFEATKEAIRATGRTFDSQDVQTTWVEIETKILKEKIPERIDESPLTYPPRLAAAIIGALASSKAGEFMLADMEELFHDDVRDVGTTRAQALLGPGVSVGSCSSNCRDRNSCRDRNARTWLRINYFKIVFPFEMTNRRDGRHFPLTVSPFRLRRRVAVELLVVVHGDRISSAAGNSRHQWW